MMLTEAEREDTALALRVSRLGAGRGGSPSDWFGNSKSCRLLFFSSRRRHTRYWRDWSSDVCSSDLVHVGRAAERHGRVAGDVVVDAGVARRGVVVGDAFPALVKVLRLYDAGDGRRGAQIGRASCRDRV